MDMQNLKLLLLTLFGICGFLLLVFLISFVELDKLLLSKKGKHLEEEDNDDKHVYMVKDKVKPSQTVINILEMPLHPSHFDHSRENTFCDSLGEKLVAMKRFEPSQISAPPHANLSCNEVHNYASISMHPHAVPSYPHFNQLNVNDPSISSLSPRRPYHNIQFNHPTILSPLTSVTSQLDHPNNPFYHQHIHSSTLPLSPVKSSHHHFVQQPLSPSSLQDPYHHQYPSYNWHLDHQYALTSSLRSPHPCQHCHQDSHLPSSLSNTTYSIFIIL